jgi:hypothetical protein
MADHATNRTQTQPRTRGDQQTQNPAEIARRELIAWCQAHQLPVPDENLRSQSNGR